ncbi:MAG: cupin domain-containing protein [Lachnospiraceae bacterium]|nr:cupin domain-containing protein [Lachnospiraceae bacterium]
MFKLNETEKEYRHKTHGPKYLEKGPNMNFGIIELLPKEEVATHVHNYMQENFYILEGKVTMWIDGQKIELEKGDYIHLDPKEVHKICNFGEENVKMVVTAAPYMENDKEMVDVD